MAEFIRTGPSKDKSYAPEPHYEFVRAELPAGVSQWGRGLWGRTRWTGRYLMALLLLLAVGVLLLAFAPYAVAVAAGLALASSLQVLGFVCVLGWLGYAVVNLVRGR